MKSIVRVIDIYWHVFFSLSCLFRKKSGKIKSAYKTDYVHLNADVDFDFAGPTLYGAAVVG